MRTPRTLHLEGHVRPGPNAAILIRAPHMPSHDLVCRLCDGEHKLRPGTETDSPQRLFVQGVEDLAVQASGTAKCDDGLALSKSWFSPAHRRSTVGASKSTCQLNAADSEQNSDLARALLAGICRAPATRNRAMLLSADTQTSR